MAECFVAARRVFVLRMKDNATQRRESAGNRFFDRRAQSSASGELINGRRDDDRNDHDWEISQFIVSTIETL
jgi:hypothetical protein